MTINKQERTVEIILQHGWAFDSTCFRGLVNHLREYPDCRLLIQTPDRGYFGKTKPVKPFGREASTKVVIAHSLGLHLLPAEILQSADLIMLASTFRHFHGGNQGEHKRSQRVIQAMLKRLSDSSVEVLNDFWHNCYSPLPAGELLFSRGISTLNVDKLSQDLHHLNTSEFQVEDIARTAEVLIVHGKQDIVVPATRAYEMHEFLPTSSLVMFEGVGHCLPLTHAAPLFLSLRNSLNQLLAVRA